MSEKKHIFKQSIQSGKWMTITLVLNRVIGILSVVILARLISPEIYGIVAVIMMIIGVSEIFTETGFFKAVIQKSGDVKKYLDPLWTLNVIKGFVLYGILFFVAPYLLDFFSAPEAVDAFRIAALYLIIIGFRSMGLLFFQKDLNFKNFFIYSFVLNFSGFIVTLLWAIFVAPDVWALVVGHLSKYVVGETVIYMLHPYRPKINFNFSRLMELAGYSKWIVGQNIVHYLNSTIDVAFISHNLGAAPLAFYTKANELALLSNDIFLKIANKVAFPVYTKLKDDHELLKAGYLKTLEVIAFTSLPLTAMIFLFSSHIVGLVLGEMWMESAPLLKIFGLAAALKTFTNIGFPLFDGTGRPGLKFKILLLNLATFITGLVLFYPENGVEGVVWAFFMSYSISFIYTSGHIFAMLKAPISKYFHALFGSVIATVVTVLASLPYYEEILHLTGVQFFGLMFAYAGLYLSVIFILGKYLKTGPYLTIKTILKNL